MSDSLLSRAQEAEEERDEMEHRYHLLASEMVYEGNSVQHWQHKAMAYKECAGAIYDLKQLTGAETPEEVVEVVSALFVHLERLRELCDYWIMAGQPGPAPTKDAYNIWLALGYHSNAWTETPATSLDRLKAQWQAEAFEAMAEEQEATNAAYPHHADFYKLWRDIPMKLRDYARHYRRKAEEAS